MKHNLGLSCRSGPGISFTGILKLLHWKGNLHITLHWALKCLRNCFPATKMQQIFSKMFGHPCPSQDHIFTHYLTQIYFIPIGKTVVISHTYESKAAVIFSPSFMSSCPFVCVLCVVVYSEVWVWVTPKDLSVQTSGQAALSSNEICQRRLPSPWSLHSGSSTYMTGLGGGEVGQMGRKKEMERGKVRLCRFL